MRVCKRIMFDGVLWCRNLGKIDVCFVYCVLFSVNVGRWPNMK